MRGSNKKIPNQEIDKDIYKVFEQFKNTPNLTIANYLQHLDIKHFQTRDYRSIKFPYESLIRLILFKKIKGFRFDTKLTKYLRRNPKEKYQLGFSKTPDRTTIGYFNHHILDDETKTLIEFTADKIIEVSEKFSILFDVNTLQPEPQKKQTKLRNQHLLKTKQVREASRLIKKRVSPFINLNQHHNIKYTKNQLIDLLIHLGLTQDFAENGSKVHQVLRRQQGPDADTLLYHLKKYDDIKELQQMFIQVFEVVWNIARQANMFDPRKKYDVAIDTTEWFYYGDRSTPMVVGKKPERGTTKCYKFATIDIVEHGRRFTLLTIPVNNFVDNEKIISKLMWYAKQRIRIRSAYLDRGFFDSVSIRTLKTLNMKFLMPGIQNARIKKLLEMVPYPSVVEEYILKNEKVTLVFVKMVDRKSKKLVNRVFATNIRFSEDDAGLAEYIGNLYRKRWGIETGYRVKKHAFRGKTTSRNYMIRLFYFLFSVLLYNFWILANVLMWLHLHGFIGDDPLVTAKLFGHILKEIDPGSG